MVALREEEVVFASAVTFIVPLVVPDSGESVSQDVEVPEGDLAADHATFDVMVIGSVEPPAGKLTDVGLTDKEGVTPGSRMYLKPFQCWGEAYEGTLPTGTYNVMADASKATFPSVDPNEKPVGGADQPTVISVNELLPHHNTVNDVLLLTSSVVS
jgi:hypothetical protein